MEFWGAEVKSGENFKVELENDGTRVLHLSQLALGEVTRDKKKEKGNENVCIYLNFKNDKFLIGTLSQEKFPQIPLDLVLHDKFELSHTWKNGSVYITGYYVDTTQGGDNESEEELPQPTMNLATPHATASDPTASRQVKIVEPKKDDDSSDDEDEDDASAEDEESSEDQEPAMPINGEKGGDNDTDSDEDDSEEESSDEDQETPEKAGPSKKRSAGSARKTPAPEKKVKLETPQKTDGKKVGGHTATPHPSKQAKKASAATGEAKQTPKSGGSFPCKSCGRSFGSENALQSHSKAKHGAAAV
ncbi:HISTONE DEACETYLASE 3, histone deacetylase 2C [Hibiscus trionum]|uniref:HISTONE DEACETYLASE 3, histone deacetylase 2C n=1 Tax=Hibiscus trionum TaxID=183268 RepID=A0A9W7MJJ9_HIBTR|nr:HISTONE DEACETYLASE 3, histone deacetylase 2C [Hibiscus trionum]